MPGGQYTNLYQQAQALGLAIALARGLPDVRRGQPLFGDIVKVTPTSKVVGDMALFMVANNLTPGRRARRRRASWRSPRSVVEFFEGQLGQPPGGFPTALQKRVLRGRKPLTGPARRQPAAGRLRRSRARQLDKQLGRPGHRPRRC